MSGQVAHARELPRVGRYVAGYAIPVINERAARATAGLLFLPDTSVADPGPNTVTHN